MGSLQAAVLAACICGGGETVLLDFYSDTCPPCQAMAPVLGQLAAKGYPIQKINVQHDPATASRFGVRGIPCFVMLVDGREVDRVVGATSSTRLEQMLALGRPSRPAAQPALTVPPEARGPGTWVAGEDSPSGPVAIPPVHSATTFAATPAATAAQDGSRAAAPVAQNVVESAAAGNQSPSATEADFIAWTVRLRVEDATGHSCGSGTIVDARNGEALILTCGHLFRESQGKGRIEVDVFGPHPAARIPGEVVHYDLEKDLALLRIRVPGPVSAARIAPPGYQVAKGARVVNVGCNNGDLPTVRYAHVTALDKFLGAANVEVSGLPVQGRSGGGLFTTDGLVIGVCNAAVPTDDEGLYAALASIHAEFDQAELPFVYRPAKEDPARQSAVAAADPPSMPKQMPPPSDMVRLTEAPGQPAAPPANQQQVGPSQTLTPDERAALEEIQRRRLEGAELICIIRSRTDPQARSEVIVLDRVSPGFLKQLTTDPTQQTPRRPPSEAVGDQRPWPPATTTQTDPPANAADIPLGRSTDASPSVAAPTPDWRPRWLASGYQGS